MNNNTRPLTKNNRGPRSPKGKASVALAHLVRGLTSNQIVLPTEDAAEWERFHADVLARFEPEGIVEQALASRIAEVLWRLRRIGRAEQQAVDNMQVYRSALREDTEHVKEFVRRRRELNGEPADPEPDIDERMRQRGSLQAEFGIYTQTTVAGHYQSRHLETLPVILPDDAKLQTIMRYEAHLNRVLKHTLHELEALQDRRNGAAAPLARVDLN
jgi:hypothetical protein